MFSQRTPWIFFCLLLVIGNSEANHLASHNESNYDQSRKEKIIDRRIAYQKTQILKALRKYQEKTEQVWGSEAVLPDSRTDVTYRDNYKQRSVVDYEQGTVKVELAVKADKAADNKSIKNELASAVEQTLLQPPDERSIVEIAEQPTPPKSDKPPALSGLVAKDDGSPMAPEEIETVKKSSTRAILKRPITGKDGKKRVIVSTQLNLVPDHIRIRAEKFRHAIDLHAHKHSIPAPLIYAIIETESFFNPTAKSPIPAFGLMQLVPETGARDAYKFLFEKDRVVKETYLYDAENNIELGVAYLHLLYFHYLKYIANPKSRQWATIAAYNTGVRNVIRCFAGKYSAAKHASRWTWKERALERINSMEPEQVYKHLHQYLPFEETRSYIKKVRERMGKYKS